MGEPVSAAEPAAGRDATPAGGVDPLRVGLVGCGAISGTYRDGIARLPGVQVVACADLDEGRARAYAERSPGTRVLTVPEIYAADDVEAVLNLTIPAAHATVCAAALSAGKHVYVEKPLATSRAEAAPLLATAADQGLRIGCAPDTVLGTGIQTARAAVDGGAIGTPVAATAFMVTAGHERWHPDPQFYYQPGGGPLFDMGPYYITALVTLLGPISRVTGLARRSRPTRVIARGPHAGTEFPVNVDTHVTGVLQHASGVLSTLLMSFDVWAGRLPRIEVYGERGTLSVPDPNVFDGPVEIWLPEPGDWQQVPVGAGYPGASRGYGLADLARAVRRGGPHRATGRLGFHVLDVMESLLAAAATGSAVDVASSCERPAPVPAGATPDAC